MQQTNQSLINVGNTIGLIYIPLPLEFCCQRKIVFLNIAVKQLISSRQVVKCRTTE
jgi:hypothetical protein